MISNKDLTGENGWVCSRLETVVDVAQAVYYTKKILEGAEKRLHELG